MTIFEHLGEGQITEASHGGVRHVGPKRAYRIGVLEKIGHGILHPHLIPDPDTHRRALFGVDRLAPKVTLVETHVDVTNVAKEANQQGSGSEL